jgi:hypothetical protein
VLINDLAQWAVIVFLAIMVFGLTRQLGNYIVGPRERAAWDMGPDVGSPLPQELLSAEHRIRLQELIQTRPADFGAVLVVDDTCESCDAILERLQTTGMPEGAPLVTISRLSKTDGAPLAETVADIAITDPERVKNAQVGTPFLMLLDASLTVKHKALGTHVEAAVAAWRGTPLEVLAVAGANGAGTSAAGGGILR